MSYEIVHVSKSFHCVPMIAFALDVGASFDELTHDLKLLGNFLFEERPIFV